MQLTSKFQRVFTGSIPTLSLSYGMSSGIRDYHGLISARAQGVNCLVLDTRKRHHKRGFSVSQALKELENAYRHGWKQGSAEMHRNSPLAYMLSAIRERPVKQHEGEDSVNGTHWIADVIAALEGRQRALTEEAGTSHTSSADSSEPVYDGAAGNTNQESGQRNQELSLDAVVSAIVDMMRANEVILRELHKLYAARMLEESSSDQESNATTVASDAEFQKLVELPMKDLAKMLGSAKSGLWLRLHTLLKPAWVGDPDQIFTGTLHGDSTKKMRQKLEARLALADRLPDRNTLEEMYALREAWDDCDRYSMIGLRARCQAKFSYVLLLAFGIATVVVSTLEGASVFSTLEMGVGAAVGTANETSVVSSALPNAPLLSTTGDLVAFVVALISSLAASFIAYFDPVRKWETLQAASMRLRSEIVVFRTRTLRYEIQQKDSHKAAAAKLMEAVVTLRASTLEQAAVSSTSFFRDQKKNTFRHGQYQNFPPPMTKMERFKRPGFTTKIQITPEFHTRPVVDDYHSPLDAGAYISLRLEPTIRYYQGRISPLYYRKTVCAVLLMLATAASSLMAAMGLTVWIAIVSVVATSVASFSEFSSFGKKLRRYSKAITKLRDVRLWWETLTNMEHASSHNITRLVESTEGIIVGNTEAWLATSLAVKSFGKAVNAAQGKDSQPREND